MKIKKLQLSNFRCFDDLNVVFDDQLTVIVGNNGSGKTSILEGVAIAISTLFVQFDELVSRRIEKTDALKKLYTLNGMDDVQPQYPVDVIADGSINNNSISWKRSLNGAGGNTTIKDAKAVLTIADQYKQQLRDGDVSLILPIIAYYGTGRLWDYHRQKKNDTFKVLTRTNGYIDSMDGTTNIKLMMDWFKKMTVKRYQLQEEQTADLPVLDTVYHAMQQCLELATGYTNTKIRYNLDTNELDVYYTDNYKQRLRLPLSQMSDGYKSTISLVADIAYRMAVLNPQLADAVLKRTDGIVLIDEIDLHLHPEWQQHILGDLRIIFPKVQFIVTTHAPSVINTVKSENLIVLSDDTADSPAGEVYGKDTNTIIRGVMGSSERPREVKELFDKFYAALDSAETLSKAQEYMEHIEVLCGNDDAELAACRVKLKLKHMRNNRG